MTYGVPYSFVPGTKAKADEVNANFIDVLSKIEDSNTRIDESISQATSNLESLETKLEKEITTLESGCANTDLSNLSTTGNNILAAKANTSIVDGTWTYKVSKLCSSKSLPINTTHTYSLSSYLPKDSNKYIVLAGLIVNLPAHTLAYIYSKSDFLKSTMPVLRIGAYSDAQYGGVLYPMVISTGRSIAIHNTSGAYNTSNYDFSVYAYRKIR